MKTILPCHCRNKEEIRAQIDVIDKEIIQLFAARAQYVEEIVKYKNDEESVIAQERKDEVIRLRGEWAAQKGLNRTTFEQMYRLLVDNNINRELEILHSRNK